MYRMHTTQNQVEIFSDANLGYTDNTKISLNNDIIHLSRVWLWYRRRLGFTSTIAAGRRRGGKRSEQRQCQGGGGDAREEEKAEEEPRPQHVATFRWRRLQLGHREQIRQIGHIFTMFALLKSGRIEEREREINTYLERNKLKLGQTRRFESAEEKEEELHQQRWPSQEWGARRNLIRN